MKWETAIKKIESAKASGKRVDIEYHTKYRKYDGGIERVYRTLEYQLGGVKYKDIETVTSRLMNDVVYIIDNVIITER